LLWQAEVACVEKASCLPITGSKGSLPKGTKEKARIARMQASLKISRKLW
jgi:hypothetical protein